MTTNELAAARAELAAALAPVVGHALDHEPARVTPPVALVAPGTPYLSGTGEGFGRYQLRALVRLVVDVGDYDQATAELDRLVVAAIPAVENIDRPGPDGWAVVEVGEQYQLVAGNAAYPAINLTCTTTVHI